jgi:hypothetical protein
MRRWTPDEQGASPRRWPRATSRRSATSWSSRTTAARSASSISSLARAAISSSSRSAAGATATGWPKQRQVARVAAYYLLDLRPTHCSTCRFDIVAITGDRIEVFKDAFRLGL